MGVPVACPEQPTNLSAKVKYARCRGGVAMNCSLAEFLDADAVRCASLGTSIPRFLLILSVSAASSAVTPVSYGACISVHMPICLIGQVLLGLAPGPCHGSPAVPRALR